MNKDKIINLLRTTGTGFLSGEQLAKKCGISRTMVWKHIKSLEQDGFNIEAVPSQGYRIMTEPDILRKGDLLQGLKTRTIGREVHLLPSTDSTNTHAMEIASHGSPEGTVVVAETQTAGKGRLGRTWVSPRGNLYISVILRPNIPLHKAPIITLMGAVSVAHALRTICNVQAVIKWPNDIIVSGKKISGLLTEMRAEQDRVKYIVLGIGINVNIGRSALPAEIRVSATTLAEETGQRINRTLLLRQLFMELERWYRIFLSDAGGILREWEALNMTIGNRVLVQGTGESFGGEAIGIDNEGRLIIKLDDGCFRPIAAGDVTLQPGQNSDSTLPI